MLPITRLNRIIALVGVLLGMVGCAVTPPPAEREDRASSPLSAPIQNLASGSKGILNVWMLDVGQGSCVYVECPDKKSAILIDCGTSSIGKTAPGAITDWLNEKIAERTNTTVLVSHGDLDHYSLISAVDGVDGSHVSKVWLGGLFADYNPNFRKWVSTVPSKHGLFKDGEFKANDSRFECGAARIDLLTVNTSRVSDDKPGSRKNADSAVLRISYDSAAIILPGDAEGMTELAAIVNAKSLGIELKKTKLLVGSHHGAATHGSNGEIWADAVAPAAVAFSADVNYKHHHPRCGPVGRLGQQSASTDTVNEVKCGNGGDTISKWKSHSMLFSTLENGHILMQVGLGKVNYFCERMTAACDGKLDPDEVP